MSARRISVVAAIPLTALLLVTLLLVSVRSGAASPSAASSALAGLAPPANAATTAPATDAELRAQPVSPPQAAPQPQVGAEAQPTDPQARAEAEPVLAVIDGATVTGPALAQAQAIDRAMASLTGHTPAPARQIAEQLINGVIVRQAAGTLDSAAADGTARLARLLAAAGKTEADLEAALAAVGVARADFDRYFAGLLAVEAYANSAAQQQGVTASAWLGARQQAAHISYGPAYTALVAETSATEVVAQAASTTAASTEPTALPTAAPMSASTPVASQVSELGFAPFPPTAAKAADLPRVASAPEARGTGTGQLAPDFALASLADPAAIVKLADLRGKPTVLSFWTTWCPYCLRQTPILVAAASAHAASAHTADAIQFVGVNVKEQAEVVTPYVAEHEIPYLVLLDPDGTAAAAYGVEGYPTTYFLNAEGQVVTRYIGALTAEQLATLIDQLLRSQP